MSDQQITDWSKRLFWPVVFLMLAAKLWLTFTRYLNQDEFESLHQGWLIFSGAVQFKDFNSNHPPIAFSILAMLNFLTSDPVVLVYLGRIVTFVSAMISLALIHGITRSIFSDQAARWAVIAYCLNVTFWEWSIEIRSDFALIPLWLAGVYLFVSHKENLRYGRALLVGIFLGLAFWANQKVVFHVVPLGLFMLLGGPHKTWKLKHTGIALLGSILICFAFLAHAKFIGSLDYMFKHNFEGALKLALASDYVAWRSQTIRHAIFCDPAFVILGAVGGIWAITRCRTRLACFAGVSAFWMIATLYLTPGPFQYYLTSVFPFFAVVIGGFLAHAVSKIAETKSPDQTQRIIIIGLVVYATFPLIRFSKFLKPSIGYQMQVVGLVNQITDENTTVFDGAGTQLNRPDAYPFHWVLWKGELERYARRDEIEQGKMPDLFPLLRKNECELVIDTYRVSNLPAEDRSLIDSNFVTWWGPIRVPGFDSISEVHRGVCSF